MKKITKARLISRLTKRFGLTDLTPESLNLDELVKIITNIDDILKEVKSREVGTFSTSATAPAMLNIYTIPDGKRYTIMAITILQTSGDGTIDGLYVNDAQGTLVGIWAGTAVSTLVIEPRTITFPIVLDEKQMIAISMATRSTPTIWSIRMYYLEEDAF